MYSSRGNNNGYGQQQQQQQSYSAQSAYAQNLGADGASQLSMAARHSAILGGPQEADISGYRAHASAGAHYGGQYSSVYGSAALSSAQQVQPASTKGAGPSALEGRSGYGSTMPESPKFTSGDYSSSSHGYGQKGDHVFAEKISDYKSLDRRQYVERTGAYIGRDLQADPTGRFTDSIGFGHQHQPDLYDRIDQASVLRQEHLLKAQALQSSSLDGGPRQADYLAARGANIRRQAPELMSYGGRMDADPHSLSMLGGSSHGGQHAPSILGAAPRRDVDDLAYTHSSSNPGYGVSLPPGRDYATGKGLHGSSLDPDYPGGILARGGYPRIDDRKDDRVGYARELERREEDRRRELLREREKDREREKERERERERKRERERILERREKERDREHKRGPEVRRERTPPRISRDRGGSSTKVGRSLRRESPRVEASHRRHSPVKEKRREYACKVYSSCLVDIERDYLSMDKRYPRLYVSPECSKVVVNWPRENLKIPFHTPVSFEHDFIEEETASEHKVSSTTVMTDGPAKPERTSTQWNAKMILMSGLSQNALEELSSERSYDDRIPHFCNMLRFAILKKENSFMAIGGPWDRIDGADPSVDNSSLVQTALRYANGITQLDLKNCQHWNPFLEIHYDRLGEDGLFSHKEITVLYIPDLSECLPSIDAWRDQWLANKKAIAERERQHALKKEKSREKEDVKDRESQSKKDLKKDDKSIKNKEGESAGKALNISRKEKDDTKGKEKTAGKEGDGNVVKVEKKDMAKEVEEGNDSGKKNQSEVTGIQAAGSVKKKIIRRVVKKGAAKKNDVGNAAKSNDKLDVGENNSTAEVAGQEDDSSINPTPVKTFTRKKITKKVAVLKVVKKQDEGGVPEVQSTNKPESSKNKPKGNSDPSSDALVLDTPAKTAVKKKIVKRVAKKKVIAKDANEGVTSTKVDDKDKEKVTLEANEEKTIQDEDADGNNQESEAKSKNRAVPKMKSSTEKQENVGGSNESGNKGKNGFGKEEKQANEKSVSGSKMEIDNDKQKVSHADGQTDKREKSKERERSRDEKEKKDRDGKAEPKSRDTKEKKKHEEPPRHPGLFLQTKGSKDSKLRSLSLSLDSLLDYTDKDIEESTFELSLFAETLYEMLQYQMGSRLLTFLQKLRIKFLAKRNQRKRQREESLAKEREKASSSKRVKTEESTVENKIIKTETPDEARPDNEKVVVKKEDSSVAKVADVKPGDEDPEEDEDPDEDPEEDEEMADASVKDDSENEENVKEQKNDTHAKFENEAEKEKDTQDENAMETSETKPKLEGKDGKGEKAKEKVETKKKEAPVIVDKELLQAFRFFDRNRVGYIRVEDMRLIIHNLGKFMSHRDVKELVQSALIESNTGRDDRILYNKLVKMTDII